MAGRTVLLLLALAVGGCRNPVEQSKPTATSISPGVALTLRTDDKLRIFATHYPRAGASTVILLFHQAGANRAEFQHIAPFFVDAGYAALAIDQRSGGDLFGGTNVTVKTLGRSTMLAEAKPDLETALRWARQHYQRVIILGSSYSAALAYEVAAANPRQISAVLVFSGGEFLGADRVSRAASRVHVPLFASAPRSEEAEMRRIYNRVSGSTKFYFVQPGRGAHGASALDLERNPDSAKDTRRAVLGFLRGTDGALHMQ